MIIETKYNYGDMVFYMKDDKVKTGLVAELKIMYTYSGYNSGWNGQAYPMREDYAFEKNNKNEWDYIPACKLFKTKEELLKSL